MRQWQRWALLVSWTAALAVPVGTAWAGGGGACHAPIGSSTGTAGTVVEMRASCFGPSVLRVPVGTTVRFVNRDPMPHVVIGTGWGSHEQIQPGESMEYRLTKPGVQPYSCNLHPAMNGAVVVEDDQSASEVAARVPEEAKVSVVGQQRVGQPRSSVSRLSLGVWPALLLPVAFVIGRRFGSRSRPDGSV
ncbi:MAG: cupredoxin domain-containing protein [Acidimicrobiia bacterium]